MLLQFYKYKSLKPLLFLSFFVKSYLFSPALFYKVNGNYRVKSKVKADRSYLEATKVKLIVSTENLSECRNRKSIIS